jgi:hypothetical protein
VNIEDTIFDGGLPVNSLAMLHRLEQLIRDCGTNSLQDEETRNDPRVRRLMWLIGQQFYGQTTVVDFQLEWDQLRAQALRPTSTKILISAEELREINALLARPTAIPDEVVVGVADDPLATCSGRFGDGHAVDIKVCNGNTGPWIDAILVDAAGRDVVVLEPSDGKIEGIYTFHLPDGTVYTAEVGVDLETGISELE